MPYPRIQMCIRDRLCSPELLRQMLKRRALVLTGPRPHHWLGVPLKVNGQILGALVVKSYSENVRFEERDRDLLALVAQQLAAAIDPVSYTHLHDK